MSIRRTALAVATAAIAALAMATVVAAMSFGAWSPPTNAESISGTGGNLNTAVLEGCAFVAQRDDVLYFASNREGPDLDIWYSLRGENGAWGNPIYFTAVNTAADEFCPAAHRNGKTFVFVRSRVNGGADGCGPVGTADIYMTRLHTTRGWATPTSLGCTVNSPANEAGPSFVGTELYFSSTRAGGLGGSDIYVSTFDGASFGAPVPAPGLNTAQNDFRPNVRRDGLEIFFDSNRPGGFGDLDLWTSTRASTSDLWSAPTNLGSGVNSAVNDLRPTLSWDGQTLYFGSVRSGGEGSQDLYVTTRAKLSGSE